VSALPRGEFAVTTIGPQVSRERLRADAAPTRSSDHEFLLAAPRLVEVLCECGHSKCTGQIVMPLREYEAVRRDPTRFLIKAGHEVADVLRIVGYGTGYIVVAKFEADVVSRRGLAGNGRSATA